MKNIYHFLLLSFFVLALTSCEDEVIDIKPPEIEYLRFDPTPEEMLVCGEIDPRTIAISGGETLVLDLVITDDTELSQLKIDVHPNFDCHGHRTLSTTDWTIIELIDLRGKTVEKTIELEIPEMVTSGLYHFQLRAVDQAGNTTPTTDFWNLMVLNPLDTIPPSFNILHPTVLPTSVQRGENLAYGLLISDNQPLNIGGNARVELTYRRLNSNNTFTALEKRLETENSEKEVEISFTIPNTLVRDTYLFTLRVWDGVNNQAEPKSFEIEIQ